MASPMFFVAMLVFAGAVATSEAATPIQKVVEMLEAMVAKGIAAKKEEQVRYSAFSQFCTDVKASKTEAIQRAADRLEELEADIDKATAEIEMLTKAIAELEEDIARWTLDNKAATEVREKEAADYTATHRDYADVVNAIERAIQILKSQPSKIRQEDELLQANAVSHIKQVSSSTRLSAQARSALLAFLQKSHEEPDEMLFRNNKQANAYESHSSGILGMIAELRERFSNEMRDLEREEQATRANYETLMQKLRDQIRLAEQEIKQKTTRKAEEAELLAKAKGEHAEVTRIRAEDEKYLSDLGGLCTQKANDFADRQTLRAEEIEALNKAIEIISSDKVAASRVRGGGDEPTSKSVSLAQLRRKDTRIPQQERAAVFLKNRAAQLGSKVLALAAQKAGDDPFGKVRKMIQNLIVRLMEEANQEADHKAWCDTEVATNKQTRENKAQKVDQLTAEVEELTAQIARLTQEMSDLTDEMTAIDAAMAKATAERIEEKAKNAEAIADAKESQTAVAQALAVLREFYAKAAQATAFAQLLERSKQSPGEDAPETFDQPYQGMQGSSGGILGLLEVIESDFARLEVETEAAEDAADKAFRQFTADSAEDKAVKTAEVDHKDSARNTAELSLASSNRALEQTHKELEAALAYFEKLKPSCIDVGVTLEERNKKRDEEILSLKEAYKILSGEDIPSFRDMKAEGIEAVGYNERRLAE